MANIKAIIAAADCYSFESDGSVALSGRLGSAWVFPDGSIYPTSLPHQNHGYPCYRNPAFLDIAKKDAQSYLNNRS